MNATPSDQHSATSTPRPTAEQARAALRQASTSRLGEDRDRRIYGQAMALSGLVIGAYVVVSQGFVPGAPALLSSGFVAVLFFGAMLGIDGWQRQKAHSIPRGAKRAGYLGLGLTLVAMIVVIGVLNGRGQDAASPVWELLLCTLAIAAPLGVTGLLVGRGPR